MGLCKYEGFAKKHFFLWNELSNKNILLYLSEIGLIFQPWLIYFEHSREIHDSPETTPCL